MANDDLATILRSTHTMADEALHGDIDCEDLPTRINRLRDGLIRIQRLSNAGLQLLRHDDPRLVAPSTE